MASGVGKAFVTALGEGLAHAGNAARNAGRGVATDAQRSPLFAHNAATATDAAVDDLHLAKEIAASQIAQGVEVVRVNAQVAGAVAKPLVQDARARIAAALGNLI
jgi:hypothetical protein